MRAPLALASVALFLCAAPAMAETDWPAVGKALGREGALQGDVYKVGLPRTDLKVRLDGVDLKPALALGSWLAFRPMGEQTMVMGDLVLTQEEVGPVMKVLARDGIAVTAVHNHLLRAEPMTLYMHVSGRGDPVKLAEALHQALSMSRTPLGPAPASAAPSFDLDQAAIEKTLGHSGKVNGGVLQVAVPRAEPVKDGGMEIPPAMGTAIALNLQPTGDGKAAATGDFVLTADEVNPVLKTLREHGIEVTALHNHMLQDEPRLFFMHFWANDDANTVAQGLRAALDQTAAQGNEPRTGAISHCQQVVADQKQHSAEEVAKCGQGSE